MSEAKEYWGKSAETIINTPKGLKDRELRDGFINAEPIKKILSKTET